VGDEQKAQRRDGMLKLRSVRQIAAAAVDAVEAIEIE
jgi:hypothetical protein